MAGTVPEECRLDQNSWEFNSFAYSQYEVTNKSIPQVRMQLQKQHRELLVVVCPQALTAMTVWKAYQMHHAGVSGLSKKIQLNWY